MGTLRPHLFFAEPTPASEWKNIPFDSHTRGWVGGKKSDFFRLSKGIEAGWAFSMYVYCGRKWTGWVFGTLVRKGEGLKRNSSIGIKSWIKRDRPHPPEFRLILLIFGRKPHRMIYQTEILRWNIKFRALLFFYREILSENELETIFIIPYDT